MRRYETWKSAFDHITLREEGDSVEILGAEEFSLDTEFHGYQTFWRYHVVPATNRPANIDLRIGCKIGKTATMSHSIFVDVLHAHEALELVKKGEYGSRLKNVIEVIKRLGDAVQKIKDFQENIEKEILVSMYPPSDRELWPANTYAIRWKAKREEIIEYRNQLTHFGGPYIALVTTNNAEPIPHIMRHTALEARKNLSFDEQKAVYQSDPSKFGPVLDVCVDLKCETMSWLNDVYDAITQSLNRFVDEPGYHRLWGWDTFVLGNIDRKTGLIYTSGSGSGVA